MHTVVDTSTEPPSERATVWEAAVAQHFSPLQATVTGHREQFRSRIDLGLVGSLHLADFHLEESEVDWVIDAASGHALDPAIVLGIGGERRSRHGGHSFTLRPGELCLEDLQTPRSTSHGNSTRYLTMSLPREALDNRVGPIADLDGFVLPADLMGTEVAANYLRSLAEQDEAASDARAEEDLVRVAIDLLVFAYNDVLAQDPCPPLPTNTAALLRLEQALIRHLRDPDATSGAIAAEAGLSVRRANTILAERGTSLMRELTKRRIDRVAHDLTLPVNAPRPVSDVARSWGFRHMSRFASTFREHFGATPQQYRQAACAPQEGM